MNSTVDGPSNERWDSESLAIAHYVMATSRLIIDFNTGFTFARNVENRPLYLSVDCDQGQRITR